MEELVENNSAQKKSLSIWKIFAYFVIYSFLGFIVETIYGFVITGAIESRQSIMYAPLCSIYGVGAVAMIIILRYFDKNNYILFIAGYIVGSMVEYIISWVGELWLHTRWWDYSDNFLNINGRICLTFSVFWGVLSILLIRTINPKVDIFIDWISNKMGKKISRILVSCIVLFMFLDCLYSAAAEEWVLTKVCVEKELDVADIETLKQNYDEMYSDKFKKNFVDKYWSIEKVLFTYPNLTKQLQNGKRVYIKRLYPEIHPYYIRIKPEKEGTIYDP